MPTSSLTAAFIGGQTLLIQCAEEWLARGHRIVGVVSEDRTVSQWCDAHALRLLSPRDDLVARLADTPFDYLFSIANFRVLPDSVLSLPRRCAINFHDAPLPAYAGLNATSWA